eukprot:Skav207550  [mRNA]  locus=scaffold2295:127942:129339:+ [translate_table: standard]
MLRIIKYFNMPLPGVAVQRVAFTADPGRLHRMAVDITRASWSKIKPESVMTWARAMVANRLATNGDQWTEHQVRHNSGTCTWTATSWWVKRHPGQ